MWLNPSSLTGVLFSCFLLWWLRWQQSTLYLPALEGWQITFAFPLANNDTKFNTYSYSSKEFTGTKTLENGTHFEIEDEVTYYTYTNSPNTLNLPPSCPKSLLWDIFLFLPGSWETCWLLPLSLTGPLNLLISYPFTIQSNSAQHPCIPLTTKQKECWLTSLSTPTVGWTRARVGRVSPSF